MRFKLRLLGLALSNAVLNAERLVCSNPIRADRLHGLPIRQPEYPPVTELDACHFRPLPPPFFRVRTPAGAPKRADRRHRRHGLLPVEGFGCLVRMLNVLSFVMSGVNA